MYAQRSDHLSYRVFYLLLSELNSTNYTLHSTEYRIRVRSNLHDLYPMNIISDYGSFTHIPISSGSDIYFENIHWTFGPTMVGGRTVVVTLYTGRLDPPW